MSQVELTSLGKSCEFFNGKPHEKDIDENGKYIVVNSKFISQEGRVVKRTKKQMFPLYKGDIVMVMSDVPNGRALAKCFIIDQDDTYSLNQRICCIRSKEFDTKYLYYQLNRHEHFLAFNNGENQTNLRKDDILDCPLILPSMEEQKRMVAELDLAFLEINKAVKNSERNYHNAKELFESFMQKVFSNVNHKVMEFGQICELIGGSQPPKKEFIYKPTEGYVRLIQVRDYRTDDFITYIPKALAKRFCNKDDIMIGRYGPPIFGIFKGIEGSYNVALMKAVVNEKYCLPDYFYWFLQNNKLRLFVEKSSKRAAGQDGVRKELLEKYPVPIPSIEEQKLIIAQLNSIQIETQKLKDIYQNKINYLEDFKSGVLKKAFENELIKVQ